jgi:hypothetical protein
MKTYKELQVENDNLTQQVAWLTNALKPEVEQEPWHVLLNELERWRQEVTVWMQDGDNSRLSKLKRQRKELKRLNRQVFWMKGELSATRAALAYTPEPSLFYHGPFPVLRNVPEPNLNVGLSFPNRPLYPTKLAVFGPCHDAIADADNRAAYDEGYRGVTDEELVIFEENEAPSLFLRVARFFGRSNS